MQVAFRWHIRRTPVEVRPVEALEGVVEPCELGCRHGRTALGLEQVLLGNRLRTRVSEPRGEVAVGRGDRVAAGPQERNGLVALEVVRLRQRDAELLEAVDARKLAAHP